MRFPGVMIVVGCLAAGCVAESADGDDGAADAARDAAPSSTDADAADAGGPAPRPAALTDLRVAGACAAVADLSEIDLSVLLFAGAAPLGPDDRVEGTGAALSATLSHTDFAFGPAGDDRVGDPEVGVAVGEASGVELGVALNPRALRYAPTGGEDRRHDRRLVILLMDHSGSLIGEDPFTQTIDVSNGSDRNDQRVVFFRQLVEGLPADDLVSLVSFKGAFVNITEAYSTPQSNRDNIAQGISEQQFDEGGLTPLADALDQTLSRIIEASGNDDLNPIVILFTDGVETGDPSATNLQAVTDRYANRLGGAVPVIVLQLQPPERADGQPAFAQGRDPALVDLACRTGGDHIFLPSADAFTERPDLLSIVRHRLAGSWRLRAETSMGGAGFPPDAYLLSAELSVTVGGQSGAQLLERGNRERGLDDTRLWFTKR